MAVLRYGNDSCVELDLAGEVSADEVGVPRGKPLADVAAATAAALAEPLDYPSLAECATPGDRVVLAIERETPRIEQIVAAAIQTLLRAGVEADGITVLQSADNHDDADPRRLLDDETRERVALVEHDPSDRRQLAYLAADEAGEAILVNRALHEADVVLPIGCLRGDETAGYFGIHGVVFPTFSDAKTLQRFRSLGALNHQGGRRGELAAAVENVAWLLGVNFTIQVVPAAGGHVMHVLAGESNAVRRRARELYRAAWHWPPARRASLVVAAIEGDAAQQTWANLGRSLHAAGRFVEDDGAIAICCDLEVAPGPGLQRLAGGTSREAALRHVAKDRPIDALAAAQIAQALDRGKVYLLSRLDPAVVEELDMVPLAGPEELGRLIRQHRSCVLLANAPYVTASGG